MTFPTTTKQHTKQNPITLSTFFLLRCIKQTMERNKNSKKGNEKKKRAGEGTT